MTDSQKIIPVADGLVKIIKTPHGEAPQWVREAWVGLVLPCHSTLGIPIAHCRHLDYYRGASQRPTGAETSIEVQEDYRGVVVPQRESLLLLKQKCLPAAQWFFDRGFPKLDADENSFFFRENEIEIISGVACQQIIVVHDEDMGDPFR